MIVLQPSTEKTSESGDGKNASIQDGRNTDTKKPEEDEIHYASITFPHRATEAKWAKTVFVLIYKSVLFAEKPTFLNVFIENSTLSI